MSKVFRIVGQVAGVIALIPSPIQPIAAAVAAVSTTLAQLTATPPSAKGQVNDRIIGANNPLPYLIGESYSGGVQVHDVGYGGKVDKVKNPYRFIVSVYSCCGPVEELVARQLDYSTVTFVANGATGYYDNYLYSDRQLGITPEASALSAQLGSPPKWGSDYKLSGFAAISWNLHWSKKAKRFAGGQVPSLGAIWKGVKVYDPRLDSTYPGGSGSHRINATGTWEYSRNPALHALAYAFGRYVNGVKVFGVDLGEDAIDLASVVAWANVCDDNGWTANGTIYEPGDKWNNLKRICQAGGAQPVLAGGKLQFDYLAPRVSLATATRDDLADGPLHARRGRSWKDRHNTIVPKYRSANHQWNYVQSEAVTNATFLAADGEEKSDELQYDLVTDKDQAAQLATYELWQRRAAGPFTFTAKPHMRSYRPGDCLTLDAELGLWESDIDVVIAKRTVDPATGAITFECLAEDGDKHAEALAAIGTEPDVPDTPDPTAWDDVLGYNRDDIEDAAALAASWPAGAGITATDAGSTATIAITAHSRVYPNDTVDVDAGTVTGCDFATEYWIYYDDEDQAGGAVTYHATTTEADASPTTLWPDRHFVGHISTPADGAGDTTGSAISADSAIVSADTDTLTADAT